jgi:excisionase family DNA binding protein
MRPEYLTPAQLAEELGVSVRTISRLSLLRKGPAACKIGRRVLFRRDAVDEWLRQIELKADRA